MGQRSFRSSGLSALARGAMILTGLAAFGLGCDKQKSASTPATATSQAVHSARIASLVPSATDLLIGAGLADHLVAVSNFDRSNPEAQQFPTAGDYQNTDWERLTQH